MRLHEITSPIKTYTARVRLSNGSTVTATERTESLNYARQIFQHKFGKNNVFSVSELTETMIDEATKTLTPQQLQVKALAYKAKQLNQQKKQLQARQAMTKAQEKMRDASEPIA